jgi:hypothetical protein
VKRLLILLVVLAGGLAAAVFSVPSNAATVNGVAISQSDLDSQITAVAKSHLFSCFLNGEQLVATQGAQGLPPLGGAGLSSATGPYTSATTAYVGSYLDSVIGHELVDQLAAEHHLKVTPIDLTTAHTQLIDQITSVVQDVASTEYACSSTTAASTLTGSTVLKTMPTSYVDNLVRSDATISVLEEYLAGVGSSSADLQRYFYEHNAIFNTACFTVAGYSTLAEAQAAIAQVNTGTPFSTVAAQVAGGGPQGCDILYGIAAELPAGTNLQNLALNTLSKPIADDNSYLVVEITSRTQTPFPTAESEVRSAVESAGAVKARTFINKAERRASVSVDPRYGTWNPNEVVVLAPAAPLVTDVPNAAVDTSATAKTSTSPFSRSVTSGTSG